jgi:hydroxymethylglutaryl-CoA reductase
MSPVMAEDHFSPSNWLRIAGNVKNDKKQKSTFWFFFEVRNIKDICD